MYAAFESFVDFLWGVPLIAIILATGLILTVRSKFFQFSHLGTILKSIMHKGKGKQESKDSLSPFQALCIAVGGTVGVSNISGVATAIATGGPGALFWIWVAAFLGMIIKTVHSVAVLHFISRVSSRKKDGKDGLYRELYSQLVFIHATL